MIMSSWAEMENKADYTLTIWCEKHENDTGTLYQVWHNEADKTVTFYYKMGGKYYRETLPYVECPPQWQYTSVCNEPKAE